MKFTFNTESRFWKIMERLGDLTYLNLLFLLTSLPIFTIGASLTAMNSVLFRLQEKRVTNLRREYFAAWKENFLESTIIWLVYLAYAVFCLLNLHTQPTISPITLALLGIGLALMSMTVWYSFAMLARFRNSFQDTVIKAFLIGTMGFPYTLVMALMFAALVILSIQSYLSILVMSSVWLLFGFSLTAYICSIFFLRIFRKVTAREDLPNEHPLL
jgi:uncharacterized membrane protein YesL